MKIKLTGNLLACLKFITKNFWEVNIKTDKEGIHIADEVEGGHYFMIFDFKVEGLEETLFRIDCMKLNKVLRQIKNDNAFLEMDVDERVRIYFDDASFKRDFVIPKIVPKEESPDIRKAKNYPFPMKFLVETSELASICNEAGLLAREKAVASISMTAKKDSEEINVVSIFDDEETYHATINLSDKSETDAVAYYSIGNIEIISDVPSKTATIKFGNDYPLGCFVEDDDFEMVVVLAPLIH